MERQILKLEYQGEFHYGQEERINSVPSSLWKRK